jgi:RimJ/RimL family protein N-acetyltransferase
MGNPSAAESARITLRPVREDDIGWMARMTTDARLVGEHNWSGLERTSDEVEAELRARLSADGFDGDADGTLVVDFDGSTPIGDVSWRTERWGPSPRSACPAIGISLLPEHRGHGHGTVAQALLVDHLFTRDPELHRVQSDTAADNPAEQRALTKIGMVEEGRIRDAEYRDGTFHDHLVYSVLRAEWEARRLSPH